MDILLETFLGSCGLMISLAALFAGLGYFKQGRSQSKLDTVNLFKEQVEALERKVNTQTADIERMTKEIHDLKTAIEDKDRRLGETLQILQGRDPDMQAFIKLTRQYIEANVPLLEIIKTKTVPTIDNLQLFLNKQKF